MTDYFAAIRAMDVEAWLVTFAEDAVSYEPSGTFQGHEALRLFFTGVTGAFEWVSLSEDFGCCVGTEIAVKWTGRGVGKNGRAVVFSGIDLFKLNANGKIQTLKGYWDPATLMAELQRE